MSTVSLQPGQVLPDGIGDSPAIGFYRKYGEFMAGVPGLLSLRFSGGSNADTITLNFRDLRSMAIGDAMIESTVDGVKLLRSSNEQGNPHSNVKTDDVVRGIAGLKGVWDFSYGMRPLPMNQLVTFTTVNDSFLNRLDSLLKDEIPGFVLKDGSEIRYDVAFRSSLPQNS